MTIHYRNSFIKNIFPKIFIALLFTLVVGVFYYWAKTHNLYGLKRFVSFQHPYCKGPIIDPNHIDTASYNAEETYRNDALGYKIWKPKGWQVSNTVCTYGAAECIISPDLSFLDNGTHSGSRLVIHRVARSHDFTRESFDLGSMPTNPISFIQKLLSCTYMNINGLHTVVATVNNAYSKNLYFIESPSYVFVLEPEQYSENKTEQDMLSNMIKSFQIVDESDAGNIGAYDGKPSPQVPYKLDFQDIDVHTIRQIQDELSVANIMKGYTFSALKGENVTFTALDPKSINEVTFTSLELYSYGPTILRATSRLSVNIPVSGRYFLVIKGKTPDSVGKYQLRIDLTH